MGARRGRNFLVILCVVQMQIAACSSQGIAAKATDEKSSNAATQPAIVLDGYQEIDRRLSAFIAHEVKDKQIPSLAISLVDGDKVVFAKGFGAASADGKSSATASSVYRVGSVSKLFTDLCVMQLVAEGKLDLDANIQTYLPNFKPQNPFGGPITLRQLMSHQAGVVRESPVGHYFDDTSPSLADTIESVNSTALIYKPGTRTKYSNVGVSAAGLVVEKLSGEPFEDHVRKTVLEPLAMPSSGFRMTPAIEHNLAVGWMRSHHAPPFVAPNFALGTLPAGNLYASMPELSHLLIALFNDGKFNGKQVIAPKLIEAMITPAKASADKAAEYGIGFRLDQIDGHRTFGHGGAVYGYATKFTGLPDEKVGVAVSAAIDGGRRWG